MLWSAQEISKKFRNALGKNISPRAINVFAEKLGYHMKRIGGKKGYDQSLYTALTRHLKELLDYDSKQIAKTPQKAQKQQILGDYYTYNGERDNIDYGWEKNESIVNRIVMEEINKFLNKSNCMKKINLTEQQLKIITELGKPKERLVPWNNIMQLYDTGSYTPEEIAEELGEDLEYVNWCIDNFDDSDFGLDEFEDDDENEWYDEEDFTGEHGEQGMFRTYDTNGYTLKQARQDAKSEGFNSLEEYLENFANNLDCNWCWGTDNDYEGGYKVIARFNALFNHYWVVKFYNGQLIFDEYYG